MPCRIASACALWHLDELERLAHDHPRRLSLEVRVAGHAIDGELAGAGLDPDSRDGRLALSGGVDGL